MKSFDKNELLLLGTERFGVFDEEPGLGAAKERLLRRGVLTWTPCPFGAKHEHLGRGPAFRIATLCHTLATKELPL